MIDSRTAESIHFPNHKNTRAAAKDLFLERGFSRNAWMEAYRDGLLRCCGAPVGRNTKIPAKETMELLIPEEKSEYPPQREALSILYEDAHLLAVDKPADLPMLPVQGADTGALVNRVQAYFDMAGIKRSIRFVNRLDRGTSGVVLIAKHKYMQAALQTQMEEDKIQKRYVALVDGRIDESRRMQILTPLKKETNGIRWQPDPDGKAAHTEFSVLYEGERSLLLVSPKTGRTHQIRAHLYSIGHPVRGDELYGGSGAERMYLHALSYGFTAWNGRRILVRTLPLSWHKTLGIPREVLQAKLAQTRSSSASL